MGVHTISSREFNQNTGHAKRLTERGIVMITDRGENAHVLMTYQDYLNLTQAQPTTLIDLIKQEEASLEFEAPRLGEITGETTGEITGEGATRSLFKEVDLT